MRAQFSFILLDCFVQWFALDISTIFPRQSRLTSSIRSPAVCNWISSKILAKQSLKISPTTYQHYVHSVESVSSNNIHVMKLKC